MMISRKAGIDTGIWKESKVLTAIQLEQLKIRQYKEDVARLNFREYKYRVKMIGHNPVEDAGNFDAWLWSRDPYRHYVTLHRPNEVEGYPTNCGVKSLATPRDAAKIYFAFLEGHFGLDINKGDKFRIEVATKHTKKHHFFEVECWKIDFEEMECRLSFKKINPPANPQAPNSPSE